MLDMRFELQNQSHIPNLSNGFFFWKNKRCNHTYHQYAQDDQQGNPGSKPEPRGMVTGKHFQADKNEEDGQSDLQETELIDNIDQQKEHGPQTKYGENIREEYDVGVFGNRKNSGYGIDGKNQVGNLDN